MRGHFEAFVSELVIKEAAVGDEEAVAARLRLLESLPVLEITKEARDLARSLVEEHALPEVAFEDALHVAAAAVHGMDVLVTWNCKHIANVVRRRDIESVCRRFGYEPPVIGTPEEFREED